MISPKLNLYLLLVALGACLSIASCDLVKDNSESESFSYTIQQNKEITIDTTQRPSTDNTQTLLKLSINTGDNLLFKYNRTVTPPSNITDAGLSESIFFELPPNNEQFEYTDSELTQISTYYTRGCFCRIIGALPLTDGYIKGDKIGGIIWKVEASLKTESEFETHEVTFDNVFIAE